MTKYASVTVALATLAAVTVLGWSGSLSSNDTVAALAALLAIVGGLGTLIVGSAQPNSNALPHAIIGLCVLVSITVLGVHGTLSGTQLGLIFSAIIPGGAVVAGNITGGTTGNAGACAVPPVQQVN